MLESMICVIKNNENGTGNESGMVESPICRFDYPLTMNDTGTFMKVSEYILDYDEEGKSTFGYKLRMNSLHNYW